MHSPMADTFPEMKQEPDVYIVDSKPPNFLDKTPKDPIDEEQEPDVVIIDSKPPVILDKTSKDQIEEFSPLDIKNEGAGDTVNISNDARESASFSDNAGDSSVCNQLVVYNPRARDTSEVLPVPDDATVEAQALNHAPNTSGRVMPSVGTFTVQCAVCFKWRLIPTKEKYEAIRENIMVDAFVCEKAREWRPDICCEDPADISQDNSRLWAIDKPNISQAPPGWQRLLRIRSEGSTRFADVYYQTPCGKKLRSMVEIQKYLLEHPAYMEAGVNMSQFSYQIPKPLQEGYVRKRPQRPPPVTNAAYGSPQVTNAAYGSPRVTNAAYGSPQVTNAAYGSPQVTNAAYGSPNSLEPTRVVTNAAYGSPNSLEPTRVNPIAWASPDSARVQMGGSVVQSGYVATTVFQPQRKRRATGKSVKSVKSHRQMYNSVYNHPKIKVEASYHESG